MPEKYSQLNIIKNIYALKKVKRSGWLASGLGIEKTESVADHSFACATLGLAIVSSFRKDLDLGKILAMSLMHDIAESVTGDIIDQKKVYTDNDIEQEISKEIFSGSDTMLALCREFSENISEESKFVKSLDKLELLLQAQDYKNTQNLDTEEYFINNLHKVDFEILGLDKEPFIDNFFNK